MLVTVKDIAGKQVGEVSLSESVFGAPVNKSLMHQALVRQLANARLGTHKTKGRSEVRGGGRKPWKQKGTGRARQGSTRAPNWVGGGTVFGPQPRKYTKAMPKKMRQGALRSALTVKAASEQIVVVDDLTLGTSKTKDMVNALGTLGVDKGSVLLVLSERNDSVMRSAKNLPDVKTLNAAYLNIRDLLGYDTVLFSSDALSFVEDWLGADVGDASHVSGPDGTHEDSLASETPEAVSDESASADEVSSESSTDSSDDGDSPDTNEGSEG